MVYEYFPAATNMNFLELITDNSIYLRTYERRVEAETLIFGSGSVASAINTSEKWKLNKPITVFPTSKVPLFIKVYNNKKSLQNVQLTGPATTTHLGSVDV